MKLKKGKIAMICSITYTFAVVNFTKAFQIVFRITLEY